MKKVDKLILRSFWGPFFLTLAVVIFIFLMKLLIVYIEDFVSKDISLPTFGRLLFYFAVLTIPTALPLATLLSSLMTFGNLGEFFELTALKSAGISFTRTLRPMLIAAVIITGFAFWFTNYVSPWANLKGYSLLYDIKSSKATLNLKAGIFYNELPGLSIKVDQKMPDGVGLLGLVIYKHPVNGSEAGNREVILADSGRMYTDPDRTYLTFELYNGNDYQELMGAGGNSGFISTSNPQPGQFARNGFTHYKLVVTLESFGLKRTDEQQFQYHEYMKNLKELAIITDSLQRDYKKTSLNLVNTSHQYYSYQFRVPPVPTTPPKPIKTGRWIDSLLLKSNKASRQDLMMSAKSASQNMLSFAQTNMTYLREKEKTAFRYELEANHKFTQPLSVFVMFLIGAPLGAIIKKGGFGLPVLVSIIFFILLYVISLTGDKYAKDGLIWVPLGAWMSNLILLPVGLYFIRQARYDSRIFDKDVYIIAWERLKGQLSVINNQLSANNK